MEKDNYEEHPLDSMLDDESEVEFGEPEIRDRFHHFADEETSGDLKAWTAKDFASIYVRFRPHLERHARRYLSNRVQAEEVVQDAFLYLMTTLPELDSELGVLKFLKWKVRLLSLDVIRSASNQREIPVAEHEEFASDNEEITADLERAEDNAIIRIALSKLNPRQREALIASVYEEKPAEVVAEQLGLSTNATRQLLFRARSAFKKALVGEAEISGRSISQVLSIAAKKAAIDAKNNAMKVGAFIVLAAIGIGILPQVLATTETVIATPEISQPAPTDSSPVSPSESESESGAAAPSESQLADASGSVASQSQRTGSESLGSTAETNQPVAQQATSAAPAIQPAVVLDTDASRLTEQTLSAILTTDVNNAGYYKDSYSQLFGDLFSGMSIEVFGGTGISAFLDLDPVTKTVRQTIFQMWIDGDRFYAVARSIQNESLQSGDNHTVVIIAEEFYVVNDSLNVFSESPLADSRAVVTLELDANGNPLSASMKVSDPE